MSKPKVMLAILTGIERQQWCNAELLRNVFNMAKDPRFDVVLYPVSDVRPWDAARNLTIVAARQANADWLLSVDNDNFYYAHPHTPLDIIAEAGGDQRIIGLTYATGTGTSQNGDAYRIFPTICAGAGPFREVESVGGGTLIIHKTVWEKIPGPWFLSQHADSETLLPGRCTCGSPEDGPHRAHSARDISACPEDIYFCRRAGQHGFKVWTHTQRLAGHYRTTDITQMMCVLSQLKLANGAI